MIVAVPVVHWLALVLFPEIAGDISPLFLIAAPLFASLACLRRALQPGEVLGWAALSLGLMLWTLGILAATKGDVLVSLNSEGIGSILPYIFYGVPLICVMASPEHTSWRIRLVDGALAILLGVLFFLHTTTFATIEGFTGNGGDHIMWMFDIENVCIAVFALVRFAASVRPRERGFFRNLSIFAVIYLIVAGYANHHLAEFDFGHPADPLITIPFLIMIVLALAPDHPIGHARLPSRELVIAVNVGSPLMLPLMVMCVSIALITTRPMLAAAGFAAALVGYGVRTVLVQMRGTMEREDLDRLIRTDPLTGLANRRHLTEALTSAWNDARRASNGLAVLMIDIDDFKCLNDQLGHAVGDQRLQEVGKILAACAGRTSDVVARYGGEEFIAVLPQTSRHGAERLAEQMRRSVQQAALQSPAARGIVTISIGLGWAEMPRDDDPDELVKAADAALYDAKHAGKDCVRQRSL
ncbi:diguanylate cyclase [Altererythrobacter xixiisoli]|uniref:diguanylate cyclase n=1 Tax=Croceibacterium xixiisoli TaxID=1476466 RepID=A0A6I4TZR7_9SPHN|nr:GGDEF domain-containing protein [Croceibacterium xixiisoli]MXP00572.1 diguanylate cyclase [Croceibacterium xixiisoli]